MRRLSMLVFLVFLTLKLAGAIDWSWGYVTLPAAWLLGACWRELELEKALGQDLSNV
jgi:hypothetical protein